MWAADAALTSTLTPRRALIGCMYAAAGTGVTYGFSMFSKALKQSFCFSQRELANLNTIQYSLGPLSPLVGAAARRMGIRPTLFLGGVWLAGAQTLFFLIASKHITTSNPAVVLLLVSLLQYFGIQLVSATCFSTPVQHFQRQRGLATAVVKSFVGLAGATVSQMYVLLFGVPGADPEALNCILLWAATSFGFNLFAAFVVPAAPDEDAREPRTVVRVLLWHLGVLITVTTGVALTPEGTLHTALVPLMLVLTLMPIGLALAPCWDHRRWKARTEEDAAPLNAAHAPQPLLKLESSTALTTAQMLRTPDAWLLCSVGSVIVGGGNMLATNMAQVVQAAGGADALVPTCVTVFSTGNMLGHALVARGRPRVWFAAAIAGLMGVCHLVLLGAASATPGSSLQAMLLVCGAGLGGIAFGSIWPHLVVLASELFGSRHLAANYMFFDGGCGCVGTLLLANLLPTYFYALHASNSTDASDPDEPGSGTDACPAADGGTCLGAACFAPTHGIIAGLCAYAVVASIIIARRAIPLYKQIHQNATLARTAVEPPHEIASMHSSQQQEPMAAPLLGVVSDTTRRRAVE